MAAEKGFNFDCSDILAAYLQHVLGTAIEFETAVGCSGIQISRVQPAIFVQGFCGLFRRSIIAFHDAIAAHQYFSNGICRQILAFHFFGYADDTPELRALRIRQANLVGPAGYISMEDTEATELVQRGTARDADAHSVIEMARGAPEQRDTLITESLIRSFWRGYRKLMDLPLHEEASA